MPTAVCPNNPEHDEFITVAHISQDWLVDRHGNFLEEVEHCLETVARPRSGNSWTCNVCGADAVVKD